MKTLSKVEKELAENGINSRLNHKNFLEHSIKSSSAKTKRIIRNVDKANLGVLMLLGLEDYTAQSKISLHPEFVAYAFHLYGLSRKLFMYVIFYEMDNDSCRITIDDNSKHSFREFCFLFGEEEQCDKTIQQAVRSLIRKNIMIALDSGDYMLNPLIAGGANENKRRKLINIYSQLLERKGLDTSVHFYPKYQLIL
jgi:hypothetical protein